ncbi:hypothetical protein [Aeoliella mucimassa]|uniref:Secreted protein n=1 Tax=Aeoliella mucimassa TaxID=2527972 RepID=A0A518AVQ6_9BACT|nr:hypothetical protein [Aeoliella mucimassa]QDU58827.1 hypothetical protein Pan181_50670 [Aeoliella mucimassa]
MNNTPRGWQWIAVLTVVTCCGSTFAQAQEPTPAAEPADAPAKVESQEDKPASEQPAAKSDKKPEAKKPADEKPPTQVLKVYDDRLQLTVPAAWKVVDPKNNLIELELSVAPAEANAADEASEDEVLSSHGRITMMSAGGDVDSNIRRWVGQFRMGRDADGKDAMRRRERKVRGAIAHVLDIAGTYFDSPRGPFGPKVERPDYRMLGAIIEVEGAGKFFVKFYGPAKLVEKNQEAFEQMLETLEVMDPEADAADADEEQAEEQAEVSEASVLQSTAKDKE